MNLDPDEKDVKLTDEEKKAEVPVLLILPTEDFAIVEEVQVHMTGQVAEQLRVEKVAAGHWAMLEKRDEVKALLEGFADSLEEGR